MDKIIQLTEDTIIPFGTLDKVYPVTIGKAVTLASGESVEDYLANVNKNKVSTKQIDIWVSSLKIVGNIWGTNNALNISAINNTELKIKASGIDIEVTDSDHTLTITGKTDFKNDVHADGSLFVEQDAHFENLVDIQGSVEMLDKLTVNRDIRTFKTLKSSDLEIINNTKYTAFKVVDSEVTYKRNGSTQFELKENGVKTRINGNLNAALDGTNNRINLVAPEIRWVEKKYGVIEESLTLANSGQQFIEGISYKIYNEINTAGKATPIITYNGISSPSTLWGVKYKDSTTIYAFVQTSNSITLEENKVYQIVSLASSSLTGKVKLTYNGYSDIIHLGSDVVNKVDSLLNSVYETKVSEIQVFNDSLDRLAWYKFTLEVIHDDVKFYEWEEDSTGEAVYTESRNPQKGEEPYNEEFESLGYQIQDIKIEVTNNITVLQNEVKTKLKQVTSIYNNSDNYLVLENTTDVPGTLILGGDEGLGGAGIYGETTGSIEFVIIDSKTHKSTDDLRFDHMYGLSANNNTKKYLYRDTNFEEIVLNPGGEGDHAYIGLSTEDDPESTSTYIAFELDSINLVPGTSEEVFIKNSKVISEKTLGQISSLATTNKNTIVAAINELVSRVAALELK